MGADSRNSHESSNVTPCKVKASTASNARAKNLADDRNAGTTDAPSPPPQSPNSKVPASRIRDNPDAKCDQPRLVRDRWDVPVKRDNPQQSGKISQNRQRIRRTHSARHRKPRNASRIPELQLDTHRRQQRVHEQPYQRDDPHSRTPREVPRGRCPPPSRNRTASATTPTTSAQLGLPNSATHSGVFDGVGHHAFEKRRDHLFGPFSR